MVLVSCSSRIMEERPALLVNKPVQITTTSDMDSREASSLWRRRTGLDLVEVRSKHVPWHNKQLQGVSRSNEAEVVCGAPG